MKNENLALKTAFLIEALLIFYKILALQLHEILQKITPQNGIGVENYRIIRAESRMRFFMQKCTL